MREALGRDPVEQALALGRVELRAAQRDRHHLGAGRLGAGEVLLEGGVLAGADDQARVEARASPSAKPSDMAQPPPTASRISIRSPAREPAFPEASGATRRPDSRPPPRACARARAPPPGPRGWSPAPSGGALRSPAARVVSRTRPGSGSTERDRIEPTPSGPGRSNAALGFAGARLRSPAARCARRCRGACLRRSRVTLRAREAKGVERARADPGDHPSGGDPRELTRPRAGWRARAR